MGTQGPGRKRIPNRERLTAEDDALNQVAREAEARLAAKRAARAEAREIRMKELERQQKELFHSHKRFYAVDNKWGHIEQWMEDSERYSRHSRRHASISDDEERMSVGSRGSLRPSDYSGFLGSGSRTSSRASSARASPVVEERTDRDFLDKGSRTASTLSAATLASLGGASSRRGSCDTSFSVETEASIREMKDSLAEAEEKYRKAMISNAQLHNEKSTLMYQVETLKEELSDMEELLWETRRHYDDAQKAYERERQAHSVLQFHVKEMEETLRRSEELLTEVSDLRLKSSSYCQEVSDLQEALQWKEKKIAALERQREISDIVGIERERLRDEVVRLRDVLKKHGVVISPDITTNGDAELGGAEDDVTAESASQLDQEPPHGGRESMLESAVFGTPASPRGLSGNPQEWQPREGSKPPHDNKKNNHWRVFKRSKSLNDISTINQTKSIPLKQKKDKDKQPRDRQNTADKCPGRNKATRNKRPTTKRIKVKTFQGRQDRRIQLRNKGIKGHLKASAVQIHEPQPDLAPHGKPEPALPNQGVTETSFSDQISKTQPSSGTCNEVISPVLESRPAEGVIQDNQAVLLSILAQKRDLEGPGVQVDNSKAHERSGSPEKLEDQRIHEPLGETSVPPGNKGWISAPLTPHEVQADLKKTTQSTHQGFAGNQVFVAEISRIFLEILGSLQRWTSDVENVLNKQVRNESSEHNKEQTGRVMEGSLAELLARESSATRTLDVLSTSKDCPVNTDQKGLRIISKPYEMEVQMSGANPADVEETISPSGSAATSCSEPLVFIDSYFTKPEEPSARESRSDLDSPNPKTLKDSKEWRTCQMS